MTMYVGLVLAVLAGCGDKQPAVTSGGYPPDALAAEMTSCSQVSDCVMVELGCCDACNGGFAVAVNTASADAVRAAHAEECGEGRMCTEMACPPWAVACDEGTCTAVRGSFE